MDAVWTQPRRSLSSSACLDAWPVHELRFAMFMRHTLVLVASVSLLGSVARAQTSSYDNVDEFYNFIKLAASDAGYDTGSLPLVPTATYKQSVDAYFWGFPLQTTYRTQISFLNRDGLSVNELYSPGVIDVGTTVEAPDVDVLYTSGFLDLAGSAAFVLKVPDTTATDTYNVMGIVTAYGDTSFSVGTRNFETSMVNNSGGNYLLVGPDYDINQALPSGVISYIQNPTAQTWLIGRMAVDSYATATANGMPTPYNVMAGGASDRLSINNSKPLAQSYAVTALADYLNGQTTASTTTSDPTPEQLIIAQQNAVTKTGQEFYQYVGNSVAQNSVPATPGNDQQAMYQNFGGIGLTASGYNPPSTEVQAEMNQAASDAANMLVVMSANTSLLPGSGVTSTGWTVNTSLGSYPATYDGWLTDTIVANVGTVANLAEDGVYPTTTIDANGNILNGSNAYTLSFPAGDLPPVNGFWSFTIYNTNGYVVPNTGNTFYGDNLYSIGSMQMANVLGDALDTTPITLYLQPDAPTDASLMPFWLPIPDEENFELMLRMYFPVQPDSSDPSVTSILNGTYSIPAVEIVPEPRVFALLALGACFGGWVMVRRWMLR